MEILDDQLHSHKDDKPSLEELKQNGYQFEFKVYWNAAIELFKKCWGWIGLYVLVLFIASAVIGNIPGLNYVFQVIASALGAGVICHGVAVLKGEKPNFGEFFKVIKYIGPIIIYHLIIGIPATAFYIPFIMDLSDSGVLEFFSDPAVQIEISQDPELLQDWFAALIDTAKGHLPLMFVGFLVSTILGVLTYFVYPLIIVGKFGLIDAIKHSFQLAVKHPFKIFGYWFCSAIVGMIGSLACCIGYFFTVGFIEIARLSMYAEIVGIEPKEPTFSELED